MKGYYGITWQCVAVFTDMGSDTQKYDGWGNKWDRDTRLQGIVALSSLWKIQCSNLRCGMTAKGKAKKGDKIVFLNY